MEVQKYPPWIWLIFIRRVIRDADHDSEVRKRNGDRPGLRNPKGTYSGETLYFVEK